MQLGLSYSFKKHINNVVGYCLYLSLVYDVGSENPVKVYTKNLLEYKKHCHEIYAEYFWSLQVHLFHSLCHFLKLLWKFFQCLVVLLLLSQCLELIQSIYLLWPSLGKRQKMNGARSINKVDEGPAYFFCPPAFPLDVTQEQLIRIFTVVNKIFTILLIFKVFSLTGANYRDTLHCHYDYDVKV